MSTLSKSDRNGSDPNKAALRLHARTACWHGQQLCDSIYATPMLAFGPALTRLQSRKRKADRATIHCWHKKQTWAPPFLNAFQTAGFVKLLIGLCSSGQNSHGSAKPPCKFSNYLERKFSAEKDVSNSASVLQYDKSTHSLIPRLIQLQAWQSAPRGQAPSSLAWSQHILWPLSRSQHNRWRSHSQSLQLLQLGTAQCRATCQDCVWNLQAVLGSTVEPSAWSCGAKSILESHLGRCSRSQTPGWGHNPLHHRKAQTQPKIRVDGHNAAFVGSKVEAATAHSSPWCPQSSFSFLPFPSRPELPCMRLPLQTWRRRGLELERLQTTAAAACFCCSCFHLWCSRILFVYETCTTLILTWIHHEAFRVTYLFLSHHCGIHVNALIKSATPPTVSTRHCTFGKLVPFAALEITSDSLYNETGSLSTISWSLFKVCPAQLTWYDFAANFGQSPTTHHADST